MLFGSAARLEPGHVNFRRLSSLTRSVAVLLGIPTLPERLRRELLADAISGQCFADHEWQRE